MRCKDENLNWRAPQVRIVGRAVLFACVMQLHACATAPAICDTVCQDTLRRTDFLEQHPDLTDRVRAAICEGRVVVGMTPDEVRAALGAPEQVAPGRPGIVAREQWLYRAPDNSPSWVYFQLGEVRSWTGDNNDNN